MSDTYGDAHLTLGEYVRRLRRQKRWDLQTLAHASGLSISHLSRIENDNAMPNPDSVVKLAKAMDGDLNRMLELADCLPTEILERLVRRADDGGQALHRAADTAHSDPGYPAALIGDLDPELRRMLASRFDLSPDDVDGIFALLRRLAHMSPVERQGVWALLTGSTPE